MEINRRKCAHDACKCLISGNDLFCSPHCEKRADEGDLDCNCGHNDCEMSIADPIAVLAAEGLVGA